MPFHSDKKSAHLLLMQNLKPQTYASVSQNFEFIVMFLKKFLKNDRSVAAESCRKKPLTVFLVASNV